MSYLPAIKGDPFTVHMNSQPGLILVYVVANWPDGSDTSMQMLEVFEDDATVQAEGYAAALADAHGFCAVVHS